MTDPTPPPEHDRPITAAEDELVSAVLDGEATPAERALVDGDARLRARLDLFAGIQAITAEVNQVDDTTADAAIARALDAAAPGTAEEADPTVLAVERRRRRTHVAAVLAAAAVLVVVVPLLAVTLLRGGGREQDVASTGPAEERSQAADAADPGAGLESVPSTPGGPTASGAATDVASLGAVGSIDDLRTSARAALDAGTDDAGSQDGSSSSSTVAPLAALELTVGVTDCAALVGGGDPSLGPPVLTATATLDGEPVGVVVFGADPRVLVVTRADCSIVDRSPL